MPNRSRSAWTPYLLISLAALSLLSGCGAPKFYPVKGQVLLFGVGLLTEGEVRFQPVAKPDLLASGRIQKDGSFSLSTPAHGAGVLEGTCRAAVVVEARQGKPVIDERFADFATSDLQFTVTERAENYFIIEVHPAGQVSKPGGSLPGRAEPARKGRK
jgi:hypothetical protein